MLSSVLRQLVLLLLLVSPGCFLAARAGVDPVDHRTAFELTVGIHVSLSRHPIAAPLAGIAHVSATAVTARKLARGDAAWGGSIDVPAYRRTNDARRTTTSLLLTGAVDDSVAGRASWAILAGAGWYAASSRARGYGFLAEAGAWRIDGTTAAGRGLYPTVQLTILGQFFASGDELPFPLVTPQPK